MNIATSPIEKLKPRVLSEAEIAGDDNPPELLDEVKLDAVETPPVLEEVPPAVVEKVQERKSARKIEHRTTEIKSSDSDEGTFSGYAIVWDSVDSYTSMFRRGCARKTLNERRGKIKVMWDHKELVGRVIDAEEDDHGLLVRCKLTMELQRAKEVRALMKDGVVNTMSFAFDSVKEHIEKGVRVIDEIRLWEVSPVVFAANENTSISSVRSTDFNETLDAATLRIKGDLLMSSLMATIDDILWLNPDIATMDAALADFHANYVAWFAQYVGMADTEGRNALATSARSAFGTNDAAKIAADWPITQDEAKRLLLGRTLGLEPRSRLALISPELAASHAQHRAAEVGELFHELRAGGLTTAERTRMTALLTPEKPPAVSKFVESVEHYVTQLTGAK